MKIESKRFEIAFEFKKVKLWLFFSKCIFLRLWHFFSPSAYTINLIFFVVVRMYKISVFDQSFFHSAAVVMIIETITLSRFHSNHCKENKFFHRNHAACKFKLSLKKWSQTVNPLSANLTKWSNTLKQLDIKIAVQSNSSAVYRVKDYSKNCRKGVPSILCLRAQTLAMGVKMQKKVTFLDFTSVCLTPVAAYIHLSYIRGCFCNRLSAIKNFGELT